MNKNITEIMSEEDFNSIINNESCPVLVDFWATWCSPCRMLAPIIDEFANEYEGKVKVIKVDVDENEKLAYDLKIRSIPTLLLYKNGAVVEKSIGLTTKDALCQLVIKHI